jgi:hypothetical protein
VNRAGFLVLPGLPIMCVCFLGMSPCLQGYDCEDEQLVIRFVGCLI